jgi:predicted ATPase
MAYFSELLITQVHIEGFRSLRNLTVNLEPVTVLVGPNGSGKTSFVDALSFLSQCVLDSPDQAFGNRGGFDEVQTKIGPHPADIADSIAIEVTLRSRAAGLFAGRYFVRFGQDSARKLIVRKETCQVLIGAEQQSYQYGVENGQWVETIAGIAPKLARARLALPLLSGVEYFAPVYNALTSFSFYNISAQAVSSPHESSAQDRLAADGSNVASVLKKLQDRDGELAQKVLMALSEMIPTIRNVTPKTSGHQLTLSFEENLTGDKPVAFAAASMSEGTLRTLAILLAIYPLEPPTLIALEEPESAVHPGAAAILAEAIQEAGLRTQVLITSHSPDLITRFDPACLRAVERVEGITRIAVIAENQMIAIH